MSKQTEAQRLADVLRALDASKKHHPSGPGGQMVGAEQYRLIAAGWTFAELHNAADELLRQEALIAELAGALRWYVETDEVADMSGNEFWLDGKARAIAALAKVKQ